MVNIFGKKQKGFTLIELVVVISILGIMVLLATPQFIGYTQEAKLSQIKHDVKAVENIVDEHLIINDALPDTLQEFDYSTALDEGKVYNRNGLITNLTGTHVDVTNMDELKAINSKLKGNFIANNNGDVYYVAVERVVVEAEKTELDKLLEKYPKLATYNNLYFVDINSTSQNEDGTFDNPYKTFQSALSKANSGDAIYLKAGEYNINSFIDLFSKHGVDFWGEEINTIIVVSNSSIIKTNVKNNFYKITFQPSETMPINYGLFYGDHNNVINYDISFYNCLFIDPYKRITAAYLSGDLSSYIQHNYINFKFINCVSIDHSLASVLNDYGVPNIQIINSATNDSTLDRPDSWYGYTPLKVTTSLVDITFDENYNITSGIWQNAGTGLNRDGTQAHIGLYGGEYAWE